MLNIKIDPANGAAILHGNMEVLKLVLAAEADRQRKVLVEQVNADSFRFQQGQIQTLDAVLKLLP